MFTAFVAGLLVATVAIILAQYFGKYNLTTDVLWLIGLAESYEKKLLAKLTGKYQTVVQDVKGTVGGLQKEISKL